MKQTRILVVVLLLVGVGIAAYLTSPTASPGLDSLPVESPAASVVSAQIVDPAAVQSIPDSDVIASLYYYADGGNAIPSNLKVSEWDGVKPPMVLMLAENGAVELQCELDVALSDDSQTVFRCAWPGKG